MDNLLHHLRSEENVVKSYERPDGSSQAFAARGHKRGISLENRRYSRNYHEISNGFVNQQSGDEIRCGYCPNYGHKTQNCRKKKRAEAEEKANKDQA
jgi:hypothetical protein